MSVHISFYAIVYLTIIFGVNRLNAQHLNSAAESLALANANSALMGNAGVFGNVAGIASVDHQLINVGYSNKFGLIEGISSVNAAYLHSFDKSSTAFSFSRFGDELFSQHILSLNYAHQIDQFKVGIRLSEHQYQMEDANTRFATAIDIGGIAQLLPSLSFGMQITNITQTKVSRETGEILPFMFKTGISYNPDKVLKMLIDLKYSVEEDAFFLFGLAYTPVQNFTIRTGADTSGTGKFFLGLGLEHNVIVVDYALENHTYLGVSQQLNIGYKLRKNEGK